MDDPSRVSSVAANANEPSRRLHEIPLAELLAHEDAPEAMSLAWETYVRDGWMHMENRARDLGLAEASVPCAIEGYRVAVHGMGTGTAGVICLFEAATLRVVGGVEDGNLHIESAHRGRGLAAEAMRLAFESGIKRIGDHVVLSPGGRATRRAVHRHAVWLALSSGIPVGDEILSDHPDLGDTHATLRTGEMT